MDGAITKPRCPFCKNELNSMNLGYESRDASITNGDLRFVDIFYCRKCGAVLNVTRAISQEVEE